MLVIISGRTTLGGEAGPYLQTLHEFAASLIPITRNEPELSFNR